MPPQYDPKRADPDCSFFIAQRSLHGDHVCQEVVFFRFFFFSLGYLSFVSSDPTHVSWRFCSHQCLLEVDPHHAPNVVATVFLQDQQRTWLTGQRRGYDVVGAVPVYTCFFFCSLGINTSRFFPPEVTTWLHSYSFMLLVAPNATCSHLGRGWVNVFFPNDEKLEQRLHDSPVDPGRSIGKTVQRKRKKFRLPFRFMLHQKPSYRQLPCARLKLLCCILSCAVMLEPLKLPAQEFPSSKDILLTNVLCVTTP